MAQTTIIKATSRTSIKIATRSGDQFYTIEYGEERSVEPGEDLEEARAKLWESCNGEVDRQIEEIYEMYKERKK